MHTVQPSQTQTSTEQFTSTWLKCFKQLARYVIHQFLTHQISYTIPHITYSRRTATNTNTTTQQDFNRQSYRVPQYYSDSHSYSDRRRVRRQNTHNHHKERKHPRKDDRQ